jgi:hypothetical protein
METPTVRQPRAQLGCSGIERKKYTNIYANIGGKKSSAKGEQTFEALRA